MGSPSRTSRQQRTLRRGGHERRVGSGSSGGPRNGAKFVGGAITELVPQESPIIDADLVGLPKSIAADLLEASTCYEVGAHRAVALLARRAVEQVVVMLGVPLGTKTLHQKLAWLIKSGHLPADLADAVRTVRDVGNAAFHGAEPMTREEAKTMVVAALVVVRGALPATSG